MHLKTGGQAQILTVASLSVVLTTAALYTLERTRQSRILGAQINHRTGMAAAIRQGAILAQHLFEHEAQCDPWQLDNILSHLNPDGTLSNSSSPGRRNFWVRPYDTQFLIRRSGNASEQFPYSPISYQVQFGQIKHLAWPGDSLATRVFKGMSQDAGLELWTSFGSIKVSQQIVLINTCTYPCASQITIGSENVPECESPVDSNIGFHQIDNPSQRLIQGIGSTDATLCTAGIARRFRGDLKGDPNRPGSCSGTPSEELNVRDLTILSNVLRNSQVSGACEAAVSINGSPTGNLCADLTRDGQVTESDLGVLEKLLRGYVNSAQVHF